MGGFNFGIPINIPGFDQKYLDDYLAAFDVTGDVTLATEYAKERQALRKAGKDPDVVTMPGAEVDEAEQERLAEEERLRQEEEARLKREEEERIAREEREAQIEAENAAARKAEEDRLRREEDERFAREEAERQRLAREKAERDRLAAEKAERDRLAAEKAERDRLAAEKAERDRIAAEKAEADRLAAEQERQAEIERQAELDRQAAERAERAERERQAAAEKAERDRLAAEKAAADKAAADKAAAEKAEADRIAAEKAAADKAEADRIAAEKAEADRIAAEKAEADRLAAEQAKRDKARDDYYALLRDTGPMTDEKRAELDSLEAVFRPVRTFTDQELADMAAARAEFGAWYQVYGGPDGGSSFLGDLLGPVTDAISGTAEFLIGNIVKPVAQVYGDVAAATAEDPITAIAKGIALATGNAWAIPLIDGADVAADGGSIGDILQATATSYVAGKVGSMAGQAAGSAIAESTGSELAGQIIGAGTGNAAAAVVLGQDPMDAFIRGGVGAATGAMMGKLQEGGHFDGLPPRLQAAAQQSLSASLGAVLTGQDVTPELITGALVRSQITMDTVRGLTEGRDLSDGAIAALTNAMTGTLTAALTGGDPSDALMRAISQYGAQEFANAIDPTVNNALDRVSGAYAKAQEEAAAVDALVNKAYNARDRITDVDEKVQAWTNAKDALEQKYNDAFDAYNKNPNDDTWDAVTAASRALTSYTEDFNQRYNTVFKPQYDSALADLKAAQEAIPAAEESYAEAISNLRSDADAFGDNLKPIYSAADRAVVRGMSPDFDAEFYAKTNNLPEGTDAYKHWLENGRQQNLITNAKQYANELNQARAEKVAEALDAVDYGLSNMTPDQISGAINVINREFGESLEALQDADLSEIASTVLASIASPSDYYDKDSQSFAMVTPEIRDRLLAQGIDAKLGQQLNADQAFALIKQDSFDYYAKNPVAREEGVTDEDIVSGKAQLVFDLETNTQKWSNTALASTPRWDEDYGTVIRTDQVAGGGYVVVDALTGEALSEPYQLDVSIKRGSTLDDLRYANPTAYVASVGAMASSAVGALLGEDGENVYNLAKSAVDWAEESGSTGFLNTVATVLSGTGGILGDLNAVVMLAGIDPESTALGEFAGKLKNLGDDAYTDDFKEAFKDIDQQIGDATGFMETAQAIFGAFTEHPTEFLTKYVGTELVQEAVPLLLSGGVAGMVKGAGKLARAGAEITEKFARNAGLGTAAASDLAEAFGGSAQGAYDTAYAEAIDAGMSSTDAAEYAYDTAIGTGMVAAVTAGAAMGLGGNALEKAILGNRATGKNKDMLDAFADRVKTGGEITLREGVTEGIEEGLTQAYLEGALYELNPNRDVSGEIAAASLLGALAGGTVAGTIYGGTESTNALTNALSRYNPQVSNTLAAVREGRLSSDAAINTLQGFGITGVAQTDLANMISDQSYTSTGEVAEAFAGTPYKPTQAELNDFVGNVADSTLAARIEEYIDPLYFDAAEIKATADAAGITLTDEQVESYLGQRDEAAAIEEINQFADTVLRGQAVDRFNSLYQQYVNAGMDPRDALTRAQRQAGNAFPDYTDAIQGRYEDVLATIPEPEVTEPDTTEPDTTEPDTTEPDTTEPDTTEPEVTEPDTTEPDTTEPDTTEPDTTEPDTTEPDTTEPEVTEPEVTEPEVTEPEVTEPEVPLDDADTVTQPEFTSEDLTSMQDALLAQLQANEDAGMSRDEALAAAIEAVAGDLDITEANLLDALGQTEDTLLDTLTEAEARLNETIATTERSLIDLIEEKEAAGLDRDTAINEAIAELATDLDTTETALLEQLGLTQETLAEDIAAVEDRLTDDINTARNDVLERIIANEEAGMSRDEAIAAAVAEVAGDLNTTAEELLARVDLSEEALVEMVERFEERLSEDIATTEKNLIDLIEEKEAAGIDRDTAIEEAIAELATDLGTTEEDLLDQLGLTEENLLEEISAVEDRLSKDLEETEKNLIDLIDEKEAAGIERDTAIEEAIAELATDLGTTEENLLEELGLTEERLAEDITALEDRLGEVETTLTENLAETEKNLIDLIDEKEAAGIERDTAIEEAIAEVATSLDTTEEALLDALGLAEESLGEDITALEDRLGEVETALTETISETEKNLIDLIDEKEAAGIERDTAISEAIAELATDLGTTEENLLEELGLTEGRIADGINALEERIDASLAEVEAGIGEDIATARDDVLEAVIANEAAGMSRDEALAAAIESVAGDLNTTSEDLLSRLELSEEALLEMVERSEERLAEDITALSEQLGETEQSLIDLIDEKEAAGIERDEAISTSIAELAESLGTTEETLLDALGVTEENLAEDITALEEKVAEDIAGVTEDITATEEALVNLIDEKEAAGIERDEAIQTSITELAETLGTTEENLLTELGLTEAALAEQISGVETTLGEDIAGVEETLADLGLDVDAIASLIGKPARNVTQTDVDFVADLIAQQEALSDPTIFTPTAEQLGYDVTGDGVIDINDQMLLESALGGQEVPFAPQSFFTPEPTGLYGALAGTQATLQQDIAQGQQQTLDFLTNVQTEIGQQIEDEARRTSGQNFLNMLMQSPDLFGRRVDVATPGPVDIGQQYDFSSIFRSPQQEAFYQTPYAEGGTVSDVSDEILRILGDK